ncbi:hypothetical protein [Paenibacillus dakarensis]|uniref:hypothetical protein n=1 Tax=Paenibacillus dakarensis TaxID=1527293 RepID=UPI0006D58583|nr:hypothetical protein [Paenibacillus dakarensis]
MCYFMHIVIDHNIPDSIIEKYINMDIYVRDITRSVGHRYSEKYYYDITNHCSCDFVSSDSKRNQAAVIKELFQVLHLDTNITFCIILDNNKYYNLQLELQDIISSLPNKELDFNTFMDLYPDQLEKDKVYLIGVGN